MRSFRGFIALVLAILVLFVFYSTNPTKQEFKVWAKEQLAARYDDFLSKGIVSLLGDFAIESVTSQKNFLFFSVYSIEFDGSRMDVLGVLNNFFIVGGTR